MEGEGLSHFTMLPHLPRQQQRAAARHGALLGLVLLQPMQGLKV